MRLLYILVKLVVLLVVLYSFLKMHGKELEVIVNLEFIHQMMLFFFNKLGKLVILMVLLRICL